MTTHHIPTSDGTACGICTAPATHMVTDDGWNGPACDAHAIHAAATGAKITNLAPRAYDPRNGCSHFARIPGESRYVICGICR